MTIYPAIDIIDGKCVRLVQGDYSQKTTFSDSPLDVAKKWRSMGGEFIHLVDLDGAKSGDTLNFELVTRIAKALDIPVEIGGGIRNMETVDKYLQNGVFRVIIGTAAVKNPEFVREAVEKYDDRIVVGIDAKDGMAAISGWEDVSEAPALELAKRMRDYGVKSIIYTDIATDGMLGGPNIEAMREMKNNVDVEIIASGGVSSIDDVRKLKETGVEGAIIGKALYTGDIDLKLAIEEGR